MVINNQPSIYDYVYHTQLKSNDGLVTIPIINEYTMPGSLVYSFLAVTELMSIIENLIAMGMDVLKPLAIWAGRKRDEITGGDR